MGVSGQHHALAALYPRERTPGTHWIGGWVGPKAGLDAGARRKICPCRGSNLNCPIVQPIDTILPELPQLIMTWRVCYVCQQHTIWHGGCAMYVSNIQYGRSAMYIRQWYMTWKVCYICQWHIIWQVSYIHQTVGDMTWKVCYGG
jgi:hypothetical protein